MMEEEQTYGELFTPEGRPNVYHDLVDHNFLEWLSNDDTAIIEKTTANMIEMYRQLHCQAFGENEEYVLTDEGLRKHVSELLVKNDYKMRAPQVVDAKRCIKYDVLDAWYRDRLIHQALEKKHPRLVFNGDETEIQRRAYFKGKVAWKG